MSFDPLAPLVGNAHVKRYLHEMLAKNAIAHSLLFAGPKGVGKQHFALAFAQMLLVKDEQDTNALAKLAHNCHPDLLHLTPEGKMGLHAIDAMRMLIEEMHLPPLEAPRKVCLIDSAERMLTYSSNALLKIFEEPPLGSVIILISSEPQQLLPTVRSRCRYIPFHCIDPHELQPFIERQFHLPPEKTKELVQQAHGSIATALGALDPCQIQMQALLRQILSKAPFHSYSNVLALLRQIGQLLEQKKKEKEKEVRQKRQDSLGNAELNAQQRHQFEKELEGSIAITQKQLAQNLFDSVVQWVRDLHLLGLCPKESCQKLLFHSSAVDELEAAAQYGPMPAIEEALKAYGDARLALERSTSITLCLEALLLRLGFIH